MKILFFKSSLCCVLPLLAPMVVFGSVNETNTSPGYVKRVIMRNYIECPQGSYWTTFTCDHYLLPYENITFIDTIDGSGCSTTYTPDVVTNIPFVNKPNDFLTEAANQANQFAGLYGTIASWMPNDYGLNDLRPMYLNSPTRKNADQIKWEAVNRGIISAETIVFGPINAEHRDQINGTIQAQQSVQNVIRGIQVAIGMGMGMQRVPKFIDAILGILVGEALAPDPQEPVRVGDILVVTRYIVRTRPNGGGVPVGSHVEIRIINRNQTYINNTGKSVFLGTEPAQIIWEAGATVDDNNTGVRLYIGSDGKIRFQPVP